MTDKKPVSATAQNGKKLSWVLRLEMSAVIAIIFAGISGVYGYGLLEGRVTTLEAVNERGEPAPKAAIKIDKIDKRTRELERGQGILNEKAREAEKQRDRIEKKVDKILERVGQR